MLHPIAQQRKDIVLAREKWKDNQCQNIDTANTYWLDESSVNCGMTRYYGRALAGERVYDYVPDIRFERTSIIAALNNSGIVAPFVFKGTLNGKLFADYVKKELVPILKKGDNFILDNASVHKVKDAMKPLIDLGVNIIFLPAYSPDFNPIEMAWSKIKSLLRKDKPRTTETLFESLKKSLNFITSTDAKNWIKHCGYAQ